MVPAAAVIPSLQAYIKIVAFKKLVVVVCMIYLYIKTLIYDILYFYVTLLLHTFTVKKLECLKQIVNLNIISME